LAARPPPSQQASPAQAAAASGKGLSRAGRAPGSVRAARQLSRASFRGHYRSRSARPLLLPTRRCRRAPPVPWQPVDRVSVPWWSLPWRGCQSAAGPASAVRTAPGQAARRADCRGAWARVTIAQGRTSFRSRRALRTDAERETKGFCLRHSGTCCRPSPPTQPGVPRQHSSVEAGSPFRSLSPCSRSSSERSDHHRN
jgi:hypothetical protein